MVTLCPHRCESHRVIPLPICSNTPCCTPTSVLFRRSCRLHDGPSFLLLIDSRCHDRRPVCNERHWFYPLNKFTRQICAASLDFALGHNDKPLYLDLRSCCPRQKGRTTTCRLVGEILGLHHRQLGQDIYSGSDRSITFSLFFPPIKPDFPVLFYRARQKC